MPADLHRSVSVEGAPHAGKASGGISFHVITYR